jgi:hypothetical protein
MTNNKEIKKLINRGQSTLEHRRVLKGAFDLAYTDIGKIQSDVDSLADAPNDLYGGALKYGTVTWIEDLDFEVSDCGYIIAGVDYTSSATSITLDAADATHPRIDVIYVDADGLVGEIAGTPAADPAKPEIDENTQLELTFITVAANATEPSGSSAIDLYLENAGDPAEWDATETTSTARITLADTTDPYSGTKHITFSESIKKDVATLTAGSGAELATADLTSLELHIKLTAATAVTTALRVGFFDGANRISNWVVVGGSNYGLDVTNTTSYQTISIPAADFNFTSGQATSLSFRVGSQGADTLSAYLDQVRAQTGTVTAPPSTFDPSADTKIVTGTTYTILAEDNGKTLVFTNAAPVAVTWPDGRALNFHVSLVQTTAAGIPTVTPSGTDNINGAQTGVAPAAQWNAMYIAKYDSGEALAIL